MACQNTVYRDQFLRVEEMQRKKEKIIIYAPVSKCFLYSSFGEEFDIKKHPQVI